MNNRIAIAAASIGFIAIASIMISNALRKIKKKRLLLEINQEIKSNQTVDHDDLIKEQLSRNSSFLGSKQENVDKSFIIVVGLGGVGSHAVHMLLRSGVTKIRLIDFDQVTLSSLNRHAVATRADVGISKVITMKKHLLEIIPDAHIDAVAEMFSKESAAILLDGNPDFVLDCIDNIQTKIDLLEYCFKNKIRVVSSMGSGAKSDPTRIHISDISETFEDPLARATRKGLRFRGINSGIKVIYSSEKPGTVKLLPLQQDQVQDAKEFAALPKFRARILPVLGPIPALFGMNMAAYVLTELAQLNTEPMAFKGRDGTYQRLHAQLCQIELKKYSISNVPLTLHDISYIFEEIWRGRSALSGELDKVQLVRWNPSKPASFGNIICFTRKEAEAHEKLDPDQWETYYSADFLNFVRLRFAKEQAENDWRYYA